MTFLGLFKGIHSPPPLPPRNPPPPLPPRSPKPPLPRPPKPPRPPPPPPRGLKPGNWRKSGNTEKTRVENIFITWQRFLGTTTIRSNILSYCVKKPADNFKWHIKVTGQVHLHIQTQNANLKSLNEISFTHHSNLHNVTLLTVYTWPSSK